MKIPADSPEFWSLFERLAEDDPSFSDKIGLPALFVFTPKGAVVFVGPKGKTGVKVDDDFKKILVEGISQTGYLSRGGDGVPADFGDSVKSVRTLLKDDKLVEAATLLSALYTKAPPENAGVLDAQQVADLEEMTQLVAPAVSLGKSLDRSSKQAMSKAKRLVAAAIKKAASDESQAVDSAVDSAVDAAVEIQTLQQAFVGFPEADSFFSEAWTRLKEKSGKSDLAALAQDRIENPPAQPAAADVQRQWKSKNGKFTVLAVLIAVEGESVRLKTDDKEMDVPLSVLSDADQEFVKQAGK